MEPSKMFGLGNLVLFMLLARHGLAQPEDFWPRPEEGGGGTEGPLFPNYYAESCPNAEDIVRRVLAEAVEREPRVAASLLRLHFHDCFVNGCDGSILLDDTPKFQGEKLANPNRNSARGFEVIDDIKCALERECVGVVSCADALAIAARESVVLTGGQSWEVLLGRRDSLTASRSAANRDIPAPNSTLSQLVNAFAKKGLSAIDMVTLSGSHTIGNARCVSFSQRLYNFQNTQKPDPSIEPEFLRELQEICPRQGDGNVTRVLDFQTPTTFDNRYYLNLGMHKGLLISDQVLLSEENVNSENQVLSDELVVSYAYDEYRFLEAFAASMIKMGNISPLTGDQGEVRRNCRVVNARQY